MGIVCYSIYAGCVNNYLGFLNSLTSLLSARKRDAHVRLVADHGIMCPMVCVCVCGAAAALIFNDALATFTMAIGIAPIERTQTKQQVQYGL